MTTQSDVTRFNEGTSSSLGVNASPSNHARKNSASRQERITSVKDAESEIQSFMERHYLPTSDFEYPRTGIDPGLVLIFNQEEFDNLDSRPGSIRDVNEIVICMSRLGFNINPSNIFTDLTRKEFIDATNKIVSEDLSDYNCLIVFFLTHGNSFDTLYAKDLSLQAHEIWNKFANCASLQNKPKLFILQACKGDNHSVLPNNTPASASEEHHLVPDCTFATNYLKPDMLVVYSTTEGNVSFRNTIMGSWFIQELCRNFSAYGRRDDVTSLIIRTTKCVCTNYHQDGAILKKQMPVFISTLTKKFYLNRNKDRGVLLQLMKNQEKMMDSIKQLHCKVDELIQQRNKRNK